MKVEVQLSASLREFAGGAASVTVEATSIRELLRKLIERFPRMQRRIDEGVAVSINGEIYRDDRNQQIPDGAEVFLLPRIQGG
ncbi:MAG TPA: MoaD/ThiS family protein [Pseudomonadales bacterium]|nr:MoaD/ThiS family protein [Pseudomonadales bacterium]